MCHILPSGRTRGLIAVSVAALVIAGSVWWHIATRPLPRPSSDDVAHSIYVWQRRWSDEVRAGLDDAAPAMDRLMVLAGEMTMKDGASRTTRIRPDWAALAATGRPVTAVMRADVSFAAHMAKHGVKEAAGYFSDQTDAVRAEAQSAGLPLAGIQIDYDCPTSKLGTYRDLLVAWSRQTGDIERSITTLPDWTRSDAFPALVRDLDYFVLQVHSFERPQSADEDYVLCRTDRVSAWTDAAEKARTPFYVALPTYGYEIAFDGEGRYLGLGAEGPATYWGAASTARVVMARPKALADLVRGLRDEPPRGFVGFVWFRMPVAGDSLNWTWPTLRAVMDGREPTVTYTADIRTPEPGLHEVWLANTGGDGMPGQVGIDVALPAGILAHDTHNGFRESAGSRPGVCRLRGPGPAQGDPVLAAWYRMRDGAGDTAPTVSRVEVVQ